MRVFVYVLARQCATLEWINEIEEKKIDCQIWHYFIQFNGVCALCIEHNDCMQLFSVSLWRHNYAFPFRDIRLFANVSLGQPSRGRSSCFVFHSHTTSTCHRLCCLFVDVILAQFICLFAVCLLVTDRQLSINTSTCIYAIGRCAFSLRDIFLLILI